jgi:dTDP-glucose 4,6-dehydratase
MKLLVTGVLGFIFSNFIRYGQCRDGRIEVVGIDKATRPYHLENMFRAPHYTFYLADICDAHVMGRIFEHERPDIVIGGAAESFVDDAISDIEPFIRSNVSGTNVLVNACLEHGARYIHISTDEVYGHLDQQLSHGVSYQQLTGWVETDPLLPRNPYSASKACAEHIVRAACNTHGLNYNITRSCNVFGPRQKAKNLVPHIITSLIEDRPIRIHGKGRNFRQYIHVEDVCRALWYVIEGGDPGEVYNISPGSSPSIGENILTNNEMVAWIGSLMGKTPRVEYIADRKGHDWGYKVDSSKLRALGWEAAIKMEYGMRETIWHYLDKRQVAA